MLVVWSVRPCVRACLLLLFAGVMIGLLNTLLFLINKAFKTKFSTVMPFTAGGDGKPVQLARVKLQLGSMITLGLTILVASDVLDTLIKPVHKYSMQTLYKLAIVAVIRTGLAYFLGKELEEIKEELEHHDGEKIII